MCSTEVHVLMDRRSFLRLSGVQLAAAAATQISSRLTASADDRQIKKVNLAGFGGGTRYTESFGPQVRPHGDEAERLAPPFRASQTLILNPGLTPWAFLLDPFGVLGVS